MKLGKVARASPKMGHDEIERIIVDWIIDGHMGVWRIEHDAHVRFERWHVGQIYHCHMLFSKRAGQARRPVPR